MARTVFDFFTALPSWDLLQRQEDYTLLSGLFGSPSVSGFVVPTSPRSPMPNPNLASAWSPPGKTLAWLFTIAAPDGCPACHNPTDGAWTVYQSPMRASHILACDACGWQHEITSEVIASFVTGKIEDPRDFNPCACGGKKHRWMRLCPACTEAARWDTCACGQRKLKIDTQCGDCREAARWDTCACGARKLKPSAYCETCLMIELAVGPILSIETGGTLLCLRP